MTPIDFILAWKTPYTDSTEHTILVSNFLAQSAVLAEGSEHNNPHKQLAGNGPTSTFMLKELSPYNLGQLLAAYEHKVFVQSVIWISMRLINGS